MLKLCLTCINKSCKLSSYAYHQYKLILLSSILFATKSKGPGLNLARGGKKLISFLFLFLFLHVYINALSVLSVPTSRNTDILSRFPTINYRILTHMGSNDRYNLTSAKSQNCTHRVSLLFLSFFLASESRCYAKHSANRIYI